MRKAIFHILALGALAGCVTAVPDFSGTLTEARQAVFPSLVYIRVISEGGSNGKIERMQSSGSGVIITAEGELLTNHHVVDRATRIRCQLTDGSSYVAKVIGSDKDLDVALLKLESPEGTVFPAARLSTRSMAIGDVVLAMGAPWGLARSVSMGILSCTDRYLENCGDYTLWYQTDAAISPGNSGGPLVDMRGEVVGLNARGNVFGAQGFTIPTSTICEILPNLRRHGTAHWAWFGFTWQPLRDFEKDTSFAATNGVIVASVDPDGPARTAGIEPNDRVISIDGVPVTAVFREDIPALNRALALRPWEKPVCFEYVRNGVTATATVTPTEKGRVEGREVECARWGFTAKEINRFATPDLAFQAPNGGLFISTIAWDGNADRAGMRRSDIIRKIGGRTITRAADLQEAYAAALKNLSSVTQVGVDVTRQGKDMRVILNYRIDPDREDE